jgi:hypothetical protein
MVGGIPTLNTGGNIAAYQSDFGSLYSAEALYTEKHIDFTVLNDLLESKALDCQTLTMERERNSTCWCNRRVRPGWCELRLEIQTSQIGQDETH